MSDRRIEHDLFGTVPRSSRSGKMSKTKGSNNERDVAKFLTNWTGAQFNRTPGSGGMHLRNAHFAGDVVCVDDDFFFPFVVEAKHLKSIPISWYLRKDSKLFGIFRQAQRDADRIGKRPMCLVRENGMSKGSYYMVLGADHGFKLHKPGCPHLGMIANGKSREDDLAIVVFRAEEVARKVSFERFCRRIGITGTKNPQP